MLRMTRSCVWPIYSKTDEWTSLKDQFDALVHNQDLREDDIQMFVDGDVVRRFGEWISQTAGRKTRRGAG
jgi:hypothetical protein